jgi:hypothetical protein
MHIYLEIDGDKRKRGKKRTKGVGECGRILWAESIGWIEDDSQMSGRNREYFVVLYRDAIVTTWCLRKSIGTGLKEIDLRIGLGVSRWK